MAKAGDGDAIRLEPPPRQYSMFTKRAAASSVLMHSSHGHGVVSRRRSHGLRGVLIILVFVGLLAGLYGGILRDLAWQWWDDPNYTHGFLVPLFSGFLIWRRRKQLAALPPNGSWIGLPVLLAGVGALLLGDRAPETFLMRSSLTV